MVYSKLIAIRACHQLVQFWPLTALLIRVGGARSGARTGLVINVLTTCYVQTMSDLLGQLIVANSLALMISIGNSMVSIAIWIWHARVRRTRLFKVFEKLTSAWICSSNFHEKLCYYLLIIYIKVFETIKFELDQVCQVWESFRTAKCGHVVYALRKEYF